MTAAVGFLDPEVGCGESPQRRLSPAYLQPSGNWDPETPEEGTHQHQAPEAQQARLWLARVICLPRKERLSQNHASMVR